MPEKLTTPDPEELARRSIQALNRRDFDAAAAIYAPDAVSDASVLGLEIVEGREAIRGALEDLIAPFEDLEIEREGFRDLGNGVALTVDSARGRPKGSSRFLETRFATVVISADGLVERVTWHTDIDEARDAAERLAEERG